MTWAQQQKEAPDRAERRLLLLLSPSRALRVCRQSQKQSHADTLYEHIQSIASPWRNACAVGYGAALELEGRVSALLQKLLTQNLSLSAIAATPDSGPIHHHRDRQKRSTDLERIAVPRLTPSRTHICSDPLTASFCAHTMMHVSSCRPDRRFLAGAWR